MIVYVPPRGKSLDCLEPKRYDTTGMADADFSSKDSEQVSNAPINGRPYPIPGVKVESLWGVNCYHYCARGIGYHQDSFPASLNSENETRSTSMVVLVWVPFRACAMLVFLSHFHVVAIVCGSTPLGTYRWRLQGKRFLFPTDKANG